MSTKIKIEHLNATYETEVDNLDEPINIIHTVSPTSDKNKNKWKNKIIKEL